LVLVCSSPDPTGSGIGGADGGDSRSGLIRWLYAVQTTEVAAHAEDK